MKKILTLIGSLLLIIVPSFGVVSCEGTNKLTEEAVETKIKNVAESGVSYEGPFLFNLSQKGLKKDRINSYLLNSYVTAPEDNPSSFTKLVTKTFMEKLHQESPRIFKDYPDFSLECLVTNIKYNELQHPEDFQFDYTISYNLHSLADLQQLHSRDGSEVDITNPRTHPNLDNFIGKNARRLSEFFINGTNKNFVFSFKQTKYLANPQERVNFITDLYSKDTQPIKLSATQDYSALNLLNVVKINFPDLPNNSKNKITDQHNIATIKAQVHQELNNIFLGKEGLKSIGAIDSYQADLNYVNYLSREEIQHDSLWSKCLNIDNDKSHNFDTIPFKNGIMFFDLDFRFKASGKLSNVYHERIFINFL